MAHKLLREMPALDILKRLDAYPKLTFDELSKHSLGGAAGNYKPLTNYGSPDTHFHHTFLPISVTIVSSVIIVILVILEFNAFMALEVNEELFVDTTRNHKLQINLDITVPRISCDYLSLDAMALDGEQHLHIEHNIFKRRLDLNGNIVVDAEPEKHDVKLSSTDKKLGNDTATAETTLKPECGSCYGANRTCCNSCQVMDGVKAYHKQLPQLKKNLPYTSSTRM